MRVLFRADSSSKIGHGHIKRDLVLAKHYDDVSFACLELEGNLIESIPYEVFILENESIFELINLIKTEGFDLLIIDHYGISEDDEIRAHYCDILLNVNAYAKAKDYEGLVPRHCELRCGFSYALIREEFYAEVGKKRAKIWDFLICMGGVDAKNLSAKIAAELPMDKKILIATSKSNAHLKGLRRFVEEHKNIKLVVDCENLAKAMKQSRKLIISASSLVNEALLLKVNFKAIYYAKNQKKLALWLAQKGYEVEKR